MPWVQLRFERKRLRDRLEAAHDLLAALPAPDEPAFLHSRSDGSCGREVGRAAWALLVCLGCGVAARAAEPDPAAPAQPAPVEAPGATLEPQTIEALRRMSATIRAAPAFTVRVNSLREGVLPNGQRVLLGGAGAIAARKPDRLAATAGSDLGNFTLSYDGAAVTLFTPGQNVYAASPLTGDLERAVAWVEERLGIEIPVRPLLAADPYAALTAAGPTTGMLVGRSFVRDTAVDHFALRNPSVDWEIWLETGRRALPLRVSVVQRGEGGGSGSPWSSVTGTWRRGLLTATSSSCRPRGRCLPPWSSGPREVRR